MPGFHPARRRRVASFGGAELLQARQEGTLLATEADFQRRPEFVATRSRAEVAAELRANAGASRALTAEPNGFDLRLRLDGQPRANRLASMTAECTRRRRGLIGPSGAWRCKL